MQGKELNPVSSKLSFSRSRDKLCKDDRCEDYICKVGFADDRSSATNPSRFTGTEGNVCEGTTVNTYCYDQ